MNTIGQALAEDIVRRAEQIEREKNGRAITEDEAGLLRAAAFLRKIAPDMFKAASE